MIHLNWKIRAIKYIGVVNVDKLSISCSIVLVSELSFKYVITRLPWCGARPIICDSRRINALLMGTWQELWNDIAGAVAVLTQALWPAELRKVVLSKL